MDDFEWFHNGIFPQDDHDRFNLPIDETGINLSLLTLPEIKYTPVQVNMPVKPKQHYFHPFASFFAGGQVVGQMRALQENIPKK
jgi:hypothetical protein